MAGNKVPSWQDAAAWDEAPEPDEALKPVPSALEMPKGAVAWNQAVEPPLRFAPWPYTRAELKRIRDALPAGRACSALTETIFAARLFLVGEHLRRKDNTPPKPDPRGELERIYSPRQSSEPRFARQAWRRDSICRAIRRRRRETLLLGWMMCRVSFTNSSTTTASRSATFPNAT